MTDIQLAIDDLVKQLNECKSIYRTTILEEYAKSSWSTGEIIVKHPAFEYGQKMQLYKTLSEKTGLSVRYLEVGVQVYKALPFGTVEEVFEELHKRLPEQFVITQRALMGVVSEKKDSQLLRKSTPLQTNFKDAVPVSLKEVIEYLKDAVYVRIYFKDDTFETYKIEG